MLRFNKKTTLMFFIFLFQCLSSFFLFQKDHLRNRKLFETLASFHNQDIYLDHVTKDKRFERHQDIGDCFKNNAVKSC